ncbi:hypothetical protein [Methylobacterium frigidaeris]|nr:hypothetical protein [Methylobacterium frigidaeris]
MTELKVVAIDDALALALTDEIRESLPLTKGSALCLTEIPDGY